MCRCAVSQWRRLPLARRLLQQSSRASATNVVGSASSSFGGSSASSAPRGLAPARDVDGLWANVSFDDLGVHPALVDALAAHDIVQPTIVQADAFQPLARGRDSVLRAETGSGKTLAYLLPLVNRVYRLHDRAKDKAQTDPDAPNPLQSSRPWIVLAPTSDLCAQILAMLEAIDVDRLVAAQSLQRLCRWQAFGRSSPRQLDRFQEPRQKETTSLQFELGASAQHRSSFEAPYAVASPQIRWGATDLVVATPAKFCEELQQLKEDGFLPACIVFDEADALFQGISRSYVFDIFAAMRPRLKIRQQDEPRERLPELLPTQFIFAAATMIHIGPFSVGNMLIERFCTAHTVETPRFHSLPVGLGVDNVRWINGSEDWDRRVQQLVDVLREVPCERTIVFVNSLHNCHVLLKFLKGSGWPVASFMKGPQGRMGPRFRDAQRFLDGETPILVATEFGGRGIDWFEVDHIINFQMPTSAVSWLHRVGRTGRMGRKGLVTNFVGGKDGRLAELIQSRLAVGKDLHGIFSRKRSLARKLKFEKDPSSSSTHYYAEEGTYRLHGGLELYEESLATTGKTGANSEAEGTLLGYLALPEEGPGAAGQRLRQESRTLSRSSARSASASRSDVGDEEEDPLERFRRELLDSSDSDDEADLPPGEGRRPHFDKASDEHSPMPSGNFRWSMLCDGTSEEATAGAVVAAPPRRQLMNRRQRSDESVSPSRENRDVRSHSRRGARKGFGVGAASRATAARNYAEPDDELLL